MNGQNPARVIFARDTRASGSSLVASLVDGLQAADAEYTDYKILTTPQLHYLVRCENTKGTEYAYGDVSERGYYEKLGKAFKAALQGKTCPGFVTVDCANGVGGPKLRELIKYLPAPDHGVEIRVVNDDVLKPENLNMQVRAFPAAAHRLTLQSAAPTSSRRSSARLPTRARRRATAARRSTATPTGWSTTSCRPRTTRSTCSTATASRRWR